MPGEIQREKADFKAKLQEVPHKPGVYLMKDRLNRIIYVGKAKDLRKRLSSYFMPSRKRTADLKTRALIQSIYDFEFQTVRNEPESILLEGKLIKDYRPRYNVDFRDDKRFLLVRIHLNDQWPRFRTTRLKKDDGAKYFGPFAHSGALRTTIDWLNRKFGLRVCRPNDPGENDYKHCNADVIRNCSAPCIDRIDEPGYMDRVEKAMAVLSGENKEFVKEIEADMQRFAEKMDFEKAAEYRDMLDNLKKTLAPMRKFSRGRGVNSKNIDPLADLEELKETIKLESVPLVMECFDISNISNTHIVASMVRFKNGVPDNKNYRRYRIKSLENQNDFASMAEVVRRRYSRILLESRKAAGDRAEETQEETIEALQRIGHELEEEATAKKTKYVRLPDLVIVDGGKGQLSSAMGELRRLGLQDLPIIGLAKEHEEIYKPGQQYPIILPHEMGALKLLQRIRDEAHRFANGYHQLLMKRRIEESILDDCPGVSQSRKEALLRNFGSVARLRKATAEEIAEVPGVGKLGAEKIVDYLMTHG
ncbi:MAG: excinuclease ABC subunit UvrC [Verrucomicrobiota bacterium]